MTKGEPMQQGKILILTIAGIAVSMASYTCWHHYRKGYHALQMWGSEAGTLIRHASQVRLIKLAAVPEKSPENQSIGEKMRIGEKDCAVVGTLDISAARGFVHARHTLIVDRSFDWDRKITTVPIRWDFALEFSDQDQQVTLVFALQERLVHNLNTGNQQAMNETIKAIGDFLEPHLNAIKPPPKE